MATESTESKPAAYRKLCADLGETGLKLFLDRRDALKPRRFSSINEMAAPQPRFLIAGKPISTPGNLTNLIAQAKAGKSAVVGALISATIDAAQSTSSDTLGITATAPGSKQLVHLDTEQSPFDHDQLIRRALKRAGVEQDPEWLHSYSLAGMNAIELCTALKDLLHQAELDGGVFAVIIDGAADLVTDVNDQKECNPLVAELHALAIAHNCPIVCVVHENPNAANGKMRGHLGSQLERKAESNLRLDKVDGITVIYSEKQRGAPIFKKDGPRFEWSDGAGMHISVASAGDERADKKRDEMREQAVEAFGVHHHRKFVELRTALMDVRGVSIATAERTIKAMRELKVIEGVGFGQWRITLAITPSNAIK